jgi:hypothetical protein
MWPEPFLPFLHRAATRQFHEYQTKTKQIPNNKQTKTKQSNPLFDAANGDQLAWGVRHE